MISDYNGSWPGCNKSNFNAPLFNTDNEPGVPDFNICGIVESLLEGGLPRHQLALVFCSMAEDLLM